MYRQICIDTRDLDYQRVLWREHPSLPLQDFQLLTVTYGTASAPYLALKVLQQLVLDEGKPFPLATIVLQQQTYVDDCLFGAHTIDQVQKTRTQLVALLHAGGFHLHKWATNIHEPLLVPASDPAERTIQADSHHKVLGIVWDPRRDRFLFKFAPTTESPSTKRTIASVVARLFDPLGWLTPVTVSAKILIQQLWLSDCDWDTPLAGNLQATKAVHLEVVTDYSSSAFLAALHRFSSRRGTPSHLYSDNGTTFRGADRELQAPYLSLSRQSPLKTTCADQGIYWHFIPPAAPHFGGLWEAAVKSLKYHLRRSIGTHTLSYEEMATLLCRVEGCLNSRPLARLSDSLDDYQCLTPGHFLIGTSLTSLPEPSVLQIAENRLSRWQLVQRLHEDVWHAWQRDYLHSLQQRPKWRQRQALARCGEIVLLKESGLPPSQWPLGRIIKCHPGDDGLVRVVTIKTATSEYTRPKTKLCFLPIPLNSSAEGSTELSTADGPQTTHDSSNLTSPLTAGGQSTAQSESISNP